MKTGPSCKRYQDASRGNSLQICLLRRDVMMVVRLSKKINQRARHITILQCEQRHFV